LVSARAAAWSRYPVALGEHDNRRIREADLDLRILRDDALDRRHLCGIEGLEPIDPATDLTPTAAG
jgi:hypothetical protein